MCCRWPVQLRTSDHILDFLRAVSLTSHAWFDQWDRAPYITTIGLHAPKPSVFPKFRNIHHNFMLANYNSQEAVRRSVAAALFIGSDVADASDVCPDRQRRRL